MKYNDNGLWKTLNVKVTDTLPVGTIIPYAGSTVPSDWMVCDGSAISRTVYSTLFGVIGTSFGEGDGSTTFNIPDLKGRVLVGQNTSDEDFDVIGETGGSKTDDLSNAYAKASVVGGAGAQIFGTTVTVDSYSGTKYTMSSSASATSTYGTPLGGVVNNLQPYIVLNYIIKVLDAPAIQAQVVNGYSTSSRDSYSCNYINSINGYSTDEIRTNKIWVDNKPIYRKVIKRETVTSGTYTMIPTGIDFSLIGELIELKVLCKQNEANIWYSAPTNMSSDEIFGYYLSNNNVVVRSNSTLEKIIVILEYTKTND